MSSSLTSAGSTSAWRKLRAQVLAEHPACHWCGASADCVDHVISRKHGGTDAADNLVSSCTPCNLSRGEGSGDALPSRAW